LNMVDSDNNSEDSSEEDPDDDFDEDEDDDSTFVFPIKGARASVIRGTSIKSPTIANDGIRASNRRTQDAGNGVIKMGGHSDENDEVGDDDVDSEDDEDEDEDEDDSEDDSHLLQDKEDGDVVLILRDGRFNGVIMKYVQELDCGENTSSRRYYRKEAYRRLAERAMGDLKKGGGALLLQVGGTRKGPFRGYRTCRDAEAIQREFDSSVNRCFDDWGISLYAPSNCVCCFPCF
jgi:hypothetical protein